MDKDFTAHRAHVNENIMHMNVNVSMLSVKLVIISCRHWLGEIIVFQNQMIPFCFVL